MRLGSLGFLFAVLALYGCEKAAHHGGQPADAQGDRAKLAAHTLNKIVGPIWPHDSTCYVQVNAQEAGRLRSGGYGADSHDPAGEAFNRCVDSLEREARMQPITPERRATMNARRGSGLPALPRISAEKKD